MGAFLHADAIMVATLDVNGKSNEIHAFAPLLDQIADLPGVVVTGDAMHCQRKHALYLRKRGAHYALPVAGNQPALFARLGALAWSDVPIGWMTVPAPLRSPSVAGHAGSHQALPRPGCGR
jgi:hypothetical protein